MSITISPSILEASWVTGLEKPVKDLVVQTVELIRSCDPDTHTEVVDYGYLVFSAAKAYEAYLKSFFYSLGFISRKSFVSDYFRIGKALNPDLPKKYRDHEWLYEEIGNECGTTLARSMWRTWKRARNRVFHFDPEDPDGITHEQAVALVTMVFETMEYSSQCAVRYKEGD